MTQTQNRAARSHVSADDSPTVRLVVSRPHAAALIAAARVSR